jgi:hypothetical protein
MTRGTMKLQVFISYSFNDSIFVRQLLRKLEEAGITTFYDKKLNPGDSWVRVLEEIVNRVDYILIVLSPNYIKAEWARQEGQMAVFREANENTVRVIPLLIGDCELPPFLQSKHYVDFRSDFDDAINNLFLTLGAGVRALKKGNLPGELKGEFDLSKVKHLENELRESTEQFKRNPSDIGVGQKDEQMTTARHQDEKECFVLMPFNDSDLNIVYEDFVKPVLQNCFGFRSVRADDIFGTNVIMEHILSNILKARIVIAELTGRNPNVFYEVGICHALQKRFP